MIALDTNVLVYAHRRDSDFFDPSAKVVRELAESGAPWAIPIPCLHEFYAVVTNTRLWKKPTTPQQAIKQIEIWQEALSLQLLTFTASHVATLSALCMSGRVVGGMIHDARIAAICIENGVRELWSADRDFSRFAQLRVRNPLIERVK